MTNASALQRFRTPAAFRAWLRKNHETARELLLRCYKTHASGMGVTYRQALDEALCFGWIDGVRRAVDEVSFSTRFTPRKPRSIWSNVNVARAKQLIAEGRLAKPGLVAFQAREERRTGVYSFERRQAARLSAPYARKLRANRKAAAYFASQAPWYRRTCVHWIMSAKREETRLKRLHLLISCSAKRVRIPPLARAGPAAT